MKLSHRRLLRDRYPDWPPLYTAFHDPVVLSKASCPFATPQYSSYHERLHKKPLSTNHQQVIDRITTILVTRA